MPATRACEFFASTLRVVHPWTRATAPGATTAVLCMTIDEVTQPDRLIAVETPIADAAQMGGAAAGPQVDFPIPQGQASMLSEEGTYVLLVGLKHPLEAGRSYPLTLVFEQGGSVLTRLNVDYGVA